MTKEKAKKVYLISPSDTLKLVRTGEIEVIDDNGNYFVIMEDTDGKDNS